jgi:rhodanese-related sulfurtransferase
VNDEIVVYCASGARSMLAADSLTKMGYKNVSSLQGGIANWKLNNNIIRKNMKVFSPIQDY